MPCTQPDAARPKSRAAGRISPAALAILAVLIAGLARWAQSWHRLPGWPSGAPRPAPPAPADTAVDDDAINRALLIARLDSVAFKSRWHDDVRGIPLEQLTTPQRKIFLQFANAERCTCGCGYTLAGCRATDMNCDISGPHLEALFDSVRTRRISRAHGLRQRPRPGG